jgi:hypothetical protein
MISVRRLLDSLAVSVGRRETTNDDGPLWNRAARLVSSVQGTEGNDE